MVESIAIAERAEQPTTTAKYPAVDWALLVQQIKEGDDVGMEHLYRLFSRGIRYYLCRQVGPQELEDKVHDVFLIVVNAIQRGDLREPERLMGFVRTVVRRQVAAYIEEMVADRKRLESHSANDANAADCYYPDRRPDPERQVIDHQRVELMQEALAVLSERDRQILVRFYLQEQTQEQICREMGLTETQFRLLKSRAKNKFGEIGKKKLAVTGGLFAFLNATNLTPVPTRA